MPHDPRFSDRRALSAQQVADLYIEHHEQLERIVASKVRASRHTIQDACAYAWAEMATYRPAVSNPLGWLATAAIREAIRLAQRERREDPLLTIARPGAPLDATLAAHEALAALAALPPRARQALTLSVAGYSRREIAARLDITVDGVKDLLKRGRATLRAALR